MIYMSFGKQMKKRRRTADENQLESLRGAAARACSWQGDEPGDLHDQPCQLWI